MIYVKYIKDAKLKIQHLLSGFLESYKDRIDFFELQTLNEAIVKVKYCYDYNRKKP